MACMKDSRLELVVRIMASVLAFCMCLSPIPDMIHIQKERSTDSLLLLSLVALWINCHVWSLYGYLSNNLIPLLVTYALGSAMSIVYLVIYQKYAHCRTRVLLSNLCAFILNICLTIFACTGSYILSQETLVKCFGYIANVSGLLLYGSPLINVVKAVKAKNTTSIPIAMTVVGLANNATWILYGFLIDDIYLIAPCVINTMVCLIQLFVCAVLQLTWHKFMLSEDSL